MAAVVPNTSDLLFLQYVLNVIAQDGNSPPSGGQRRLKLFTNNLTPSKSNVIGDLTESSASGYSSPTLTGISWTLTSVAGVNSATYAAQTFTFTTSATIYGYYVTTDEVSPNLMWVERFSVSPYTFPAGGGEIAITPKLIFN